jgi:hypothetical protein
MAWLGIAVPYTVLSVLEPWSLGLPVKAFEWKTGIKSYSSITFPYGIYRPSLWFFLLCGIAWPQEGRKLAQYLLKDHSFSSIRPAGKVDRRRKTTRARRSGEDGGPSFLWQLSRRKFDADDSVALINNICVTPR